MELKAVFIQLVNRHTQDGSKALTLWKEIEKKYSSRKRHYHTLAHLEALLNQLGECRKLVTDHDTLLFSVFYHDIIYGTLKSNNEEKSAELAVKRLSEINFPANKIAFCKEQILATKTHVYSGNTDCDLFTDTDLSILGQPPELYEKYCKQIRKEYTIYQDIVYKPARKKVVAHFLDMERIYKTDHFFKKFEQQARRNLQNEAHNLL